MEFRKLIKFGNSSFVVSLPRKWVERNKLTKGDILYFNENGYNEIVISPRDNDRKKKPSRVAIDIKDKPLSTVKREIMSAYINNYDVMKITGDLSSVRPDVDNMLHGLLALEIMEDTPDKILVKDFLNIEDISLRDVMRRMDVMVRLMLNYIELSFQKNMCDKLSHVEKSVNKLSFLMFRVIRRALKDPNVMKYLKLDSNVDLLDYWIITDKVEGIADDTRRIARFLKKVKLDEKLKNNLIKQFQETRNNYVRVMKAFYADNRKSAHDVAIEVYNCLVQWDNILDKSSCPDRICGPLVERFKAIDGQLRAIIRVVVDRRGKGEHNPGQ